MTKKKLFNQLQKTVWVKRDDSLQYSTPIGSYWIRYDKKRKHLSLTWFSHKFFNKDGWTEGLADTIMAFVKGNDARFNFWVHEEWCRGFSFGMDGLENL